ncbi:MAG: RluA family pseudouridine synthase, partial [Gemmataceae bacterium]|nr:RluA family pseudouridine synthase [Gemmataceae bacterium]MDW8265054.1 RluA family pseudouridine synthase [Gemmataceae bacterium]
GGPWGFPPCAGGFGGCGGVWGGSRPLGPPHRQVLGAGAAVTAAMSTPLAILFEDNHCLAVAKPAPLLTQGVPPGIPTLEGLVRAYIKERYHKPGNVYLGIPHRLDRPVSGVVLFARTSKAARRLAEQFAQRQVAKVYWALLEAEPQPSEGVWHDWVRKHPEESRAEVVTTDDPGARQAVVEYRVLGRGPEGTLVEFRPQTGRMHQLRVQAAARGAPVRGDALYGAREPFGPPADSPRDRVIALHARSLTFLHPIRYEPVQVTAPLPEWWPASVRGLAAPCAVPRRGGTA